MNLPEQKRIAVFSREYFRVQVPTLRARVEVAASRSPTACGHTQSATRTDALLKDWHEEFTRATFKKLRAARNEGQCIATAPFLARTRLKRNTAGTQITQRNASMRKLSI